MRFPHASLVVALGLLACTGQKSRPDPGPTNHGSGSGVVGGQGTGGATTGGASSVGGMGGMGGMTTTTTTTTGTGGGIAHPASEIYPYCGCIADQAMISACSVCWTAKSDPTNGTCKDQVAACYAVGNACGGMLDDVKLCAGLDPTCYDTIQQQNPSAWDDVVATAKCLCDACPAPGQCDSASCQ